MKRAGNEKRLLSVFLSITLVLMCTVSILPTKAKAAASTPVISMNSYAQSADTTSTTTFRPGDTFYLKMYIDNTVQSDASYNYVGVADAVTWFHFNGDAFSIISYDVGADNSTWTVVPGTGTGTGSVAYQSAVDSVSMTMSDAIATSGAPKNIAILGVKVNSGASSGVYNLAWDKGGNNTYLTGYDSDKNNSAVYASADSSSTADDTCNFGLIYNDATVTIVTPPAKPTIGTATAAGNNSGATVSWTALGTAPTEYRVYYSTGTPTTSSSYATFASDVTSGTVPSLTSGTAYNFAVAGYDSTAGVGTLSEVVPATPIAAPVMSAATAGDGSVTLSWGMVTGASGYNVYRSTLSGTYTTALASPTETGYTDITALNGTQYSYVVTAVNASSEESARSNERSATPAALVNAVAPVITASLLSPTTNAGTAVTALNATATVSDAGTISYAWYSNTTASTTGGTALGVTTPTYAPPVATAGIHYYYCVVTNTNNSVSGTKTASATSNASTVTVNALSNDATLSGLTYSVGTGTATAVSSFASGTMAYNVTLPYGTSPTAAITLAGTKKDSGASISAKTDATLSDGAGTATITVTAADTTTTNTYSLYFTTSTVELFTVTFDSLGGSAVSTITGVSAGSTISAPAAPTNSGYTLAGWYKEAACTNAWNFSTGTVTTNVTLYALWTSNSSGSGGGSVSSGGNSGGSTTTVTTDNGTTTATIGATVEAGTVGTVVASATTTQISDALKASAAEAGSEGAKKQIITVNVSSTSDATSVSVTIPQTAFANIASSSADVLRFTNAIGTVSLDSSAIDSINKNTSNSVIIAMATASTSSFSQDVRTTIGSRPVYELSITSGGNAISSFGGGNATVSIPYALASGENASQIVIYYVSDTAGLVMVTNSRYDAVTGAVEFTTTHFSKYAVGYRLMNFTDVSGWYADYVNYLAAREIVNGMSDKIFNPDASITRAQFVTILANLSGSNLSGYTTSSFTDVSKTDWYCAAVEWAHENGIVLGFDGRLDPNGSITRQDIAVMIVRYAENVAKYTLPITTSATTFKDSDKIASYASSAVIAMQRSGIIVGNDDGGFAPTGNATRAEAAKMIALLLQNMIG